MAQNAKLLQYVFVFTKMRAILMTCICGRNIEINILAVKNDTVTLAPENKIQMTLSRTLTV